MEDLSKDSKGQSNTSVRSLPPRRMKNIRQMFEENAGSSSSGPNKAEADTESYVRVTQSKFESPDSGASNFPVKRWRQHIQEPKNLAEPKLSPRRRPKTAVSPTRLNDDHFPRPSPRKSVLFNDNTDISKGLTDLPVKSFGEMASAIIDVGEEKSTKTPRVPLNNSDALDRPLPAKRTDISPNRLGNTSKSGLTHVDKVHQSDRQVGKEQNLHGLKSSSENTRPVSVMDRLKMFEKNDSQSLQDSPHTSTPQAKPAKPPPPCRQRSLTDTSDKTEEREAKIPPERPPLRQTSLVEKTASEQEKDTPKVKFLDHVEHDHINTKPTPPRKPPRTHAHDDYIKSKFDKEKSVDNKVPNGDSVRDTKTDFSNENTFPRSSVRKNRPSRPPPPRKPRPFSIAVDSLDFSNSDSSDSEKTKSVPSNGTFYECVPFAKTNRSDDPIKHWDLPRVNHPEPIRRSLSSDCVSKAVDDDGNVVYMEPDKLGLSQSGGFDIYVDDTGYAVPHRLVKKSKSSNSTDPENPRPIGDRVKSKFRKIKNLFSETDKNATEDKKGSRHSSQNWKLEAIKQKVDQAFDVLRGSVRNRDTDSMDSENTSTDSTADTDSKIDETEIRKRVEYSRSVRIKTSKSTKENQKQKEKRYPQLFEHAMIVGLELGDDSSVYSPIMKYKFPEIRNYKLTMEGKLFPLSDGPCLLSFDQKGSFLHVNPLPYDEILDQTRLKVFADDKLNKDTNVSVPLFCFPDAANFKPSSFNSKSQSYNFVLTNIDGGRVYGYCRRFVPPKSKVPEVICIISPVSAFKMYNTLLEEIEIKRRLSIDSAQELIAAAFGRPLPAPGQSETIRTLDQEGEMETLFLTREADNRVENVNCECVLSILGVDKMLKVFATILNERSVLFCAKTLSNLSSTINGITSLLYPFSWQHTFIPVLPAEMIDVICSPTPYIIGITSTLVPNALTLPLDENVLIVDIDKKSFIRSQGDESTLLPGKMTKALKTSLNMCRVDSDAKSVPDLMICEAFLRFFIEVMGHYGQYIITGKDGKKSFQKEEFVKGARSSSLQQLLEWFVETQMFEVFTTEQIEKKDWGNTIEYFQSRIQEVKCNPGRQFKRKLAKKLS